MNEKLKEKLANLPETPGSYQMLDVNGRIIYVGKAKNLKNRVRSYFVGAHNEKTTALVSKIDDLTYIETTNETEAFLLEISLIKEHQPFYNIDLTDDKTYPYIEFTKEKNPKLIITRHLSKKNNRFFGPYPNVTEAKKTIDLLNGLYKMRKCKSLPKKPCIYKEIGECFAPCINPTSQDAYDNIYKEIKAFLNGQDKTIIIKLKQEMAEYSKNMEYEKAAKVRNTLEAINTTVVKQDVILKDKIDVDVFGINYDESYLSITILYVRNGKIILSKSDVFAFFFDVQNAILEYVQNHYSQVSSPDNIFVEKEYLDLFSLLGCLSNISAPIKGAKKKLLEIAKENSETKLFNQNKIQLDKKRKVIEELGLILGIPTPYRIESFDNSNLFGDSPVSSMVVYIGGKKAPKEYRKYLVKSISGPNDYGTMKEVVGRRYTRVKEENLKMPDLILADGGEIQVSAMEEVLKELDLNINVAGMKKDDSHKTDTLIFKGKEIPLDKHSDIYAFLFEVQEEVHRFAITFHRTLKEKNAFSSILDEIDGIGATLKTRLLDTYKTTANILAASDKDLKDLGLNSKVIEDLRKRLEELEEFE